MSRKRRIKCDEGKPACVQCTSSLRRCEGYQPLQAWLFKPRAPSPKRATTSTALTVAGNRVSPLVHSVSSLASVGDHKDKRSFQFWVEQAAPVFSCYFGHSFWTQMLPKLGLDASRPAVQHMLLATSSLVESTTLDGVALDENLVFQSHYMKAIQETAASPQTETVLMACLLFACCEFVQGSILAGLHHIHAGLNIIHEWATSNNETKESTLIIDTITPIFLAYIDKAPTYGMGDVTTCTAQCAQLVRPNLELPVIGHIGSLRYAQCALDGIGHHVARLADWRRSALVASPPHKVKELLADWWNQFQQFEAKMPETHRQRYSLSLQLLSISHTLLSIMAKASGSPGESVYRDFDKEFAWIVTKFDRLARTWAKDPSSKFISGRDHLERHAGYIAPLFFTAVKCRNPQIRTAALRHLLNLRVAENNWTSCTAYRMARKIMEIEHSRAISKPRICPGTQPMHEEHLIRPVEASISNKKQTEAALEYASHPYSASNATCEEHPTILLRATIDLKSCPTASKAYWPLSRVLRIGGYQSGAIKPLPTGCECGKASQQKGLLLLKSKPL
ncbi:uncharacterized protein A1O9_01783 [Exophiala aquamarina CBS 119918]|uniref:Zn(2)-C6 fungal-type domain-containing protein n=1 Tax=Exophiala aquamarina CBS 119918 TaxID=1182545 RepID=A0A072Q7C4_9EURO|nr:uncharacterized protein A1O9_01783 [Exophiala aquamarina CBS 119918]KEF63805.1 hypothetical protein A1O9_01783 [Exophiala aquamarina CBS 119918]